MQGVKATAAAVAMLVVLGMAQVSFELSLRERRPLIKKINQQDVSYVGLILETATDENSLLSSGRYVPCPCTPNITVKGRTFHFGKLNGVNIIYVKTEGGGISTASTAQLLAELCDIEGFVHYGAVGSTNDSLFISDVVVPKKVAYYANVQFEAYNSSKMDLKFGDYNLPEAGENSLGGFTFRPIKLFNASGIFESTFWLPINSSWSDIAEQIQDVELEPCPSTTECQPAEPAIVYGLRAGTADVYLENAAMREFMYTQFKISVVDTTTASVVWVALVNNLPVVVFKGVSNTAGGSTACSSCSYLGSVNAFNAAAAFVALIGNTSSTLMKNSS